MAPLTKLSGEAQRQETRDSIGVVSPRDDVVPSPRELAGRALVRLALVVPPRWCASRLGAIAAVLVGLHVWIHIVHYRMGTVSWSLRSLFDLDLEQGFGTWFSSSLLLAAGLASLACSRIDADHGELRTPWRWLGPGFVLLSIDEVAGFHEAFNAATDVSWAIPAAALVVAGGLALLPAVLRLPRRTALWLALAGVVYFGGAVGVELASTLLFERLDNLPYELSVGLEEGLEMAGAIVFLVTALDHLGRGRRGANAHRRSTPSPP